MKSTSKQSERLRRLLQETHHARENLTGDNLWARQTMRRIHHLAVSGRTSSAVDFLEPYFWRWFTAGGVATAVMALLLLNFQFVPDADLWSFLIYENETMNMLQALLY